MDQEQTGQRQTLGNEAEVRFAAFGDRAVEGKVDTGATTSSLHATKLSINKERNQVTFFSEALSQNMVTLEMDGAQEVHSADGGGTTRPMVKLDVTIDGTPLRGVTFNLNDRTNMDSQVLIGQNILKAGQFTIDPTRGGDQQPADQSPEQTMQTRESTILSAINVLTENNVTLGEIVAYLQTAAVNRIKD